MTSFKVISVSFSASVAVHALVGFSLILPVDPQKRLLEESIQIDSVRYVKVSETVIDSVAPSAVKQSAPKKVKGIPIPRTTEPPPVPTRESEPSDLQKIIDEKIKMQTRQLQRLESATPPPRVAASMTSAELITDPVKGRIFMDYFSRVKARIQDTVYHKTGRQEFGRGNVCLAFVLNSKGELERASVLEQGTDADGDVQELAMDCLRRSAPFGAFPKNLGPDRIVFNITIFFDGRG